MWSILAGALPCDMRTRSVDCYYSDSCIVSRVVPIWEHIAASRYSCRFVFLSSLANSIIATIKTTCFAS